MSRKRIYLAACLVVSLAVGGAVLLVNRVPIVASGLESHPKPVASFDEAVKGIQALQSLDGPGISEPCRTRFWSHGRRTGRVAVLFHGLTNCPQQYSKLAPLFYEQGYNVLIPRMPRNGLLDVTTPELKKLTAGEMRDHADQVIDLAAGLGDRMVVVGFSAGGVISSWVAQNRTEPELVVTISPALGVTPLGVPVSRFLARLMKVTPDFVIPIRTLSTPPFYTYTGYSSKALSEMLRLSEAVFAQASQRPPAAKRLLVVINPSDKAVNARRIRQLLEIWNRTAAGRVEVREFRADLNLTHDLIDPSQRDQKVAIVYPALMHWIAAVR